MTQDPICGMAVDEKTALKLTEYGKTYYFCSEHCLRKFAKERNVHPNSVEAACRCAPTVPLYKNKTVIVATALLGLVAASYWFPLLAPFRRTLYVYFKAIWWAILLGLAIGGIIDYYIPREYISSILAQSRKRTIFYSVILGFFMSVCSHGILALSIELHKKGASNPAVVSFLLASPWTNLTLTIMLIGFFGLKAIYIMLSALVVAVTTGLIFQLLEKRGLIETNHNTVNVESDFSVLSDIRRRLEERTFSKASTLFSARA